MKLARFLYNGTENYGPVFKGMVFPASTLLGRKDLPGTLDELIADERLLSLFKEEGPSAARNTMGTPVADVRLLHPVARPGKIVCMGVNYIDHAREAGKEPPRNPIIFMKGRNALTGPYDPITYPPITSQLDYEGELVVVIGKLGKRIPRGQALSFVAGYMIANDVSARDIQMEDGQWTRGKTLDSFSPTGPWITTADEVENPSELSIRTYVNGQKRQEGNTRDMVFGVAMSIELLSQAMTFEPGDLLLTGTPSGVGHYMKPTPRYLEVGDSVRIEISGLGHIENKVVAESP